MTHAIVQTSAADTSPPFDPATFWTEFHHDTVTIEGVKLHFVEGGSGAPILLLPGWPQSWYAWRYVMPLLAKAGRRVIALDPRGMGDSDRPNSGYEMPAVAAELHGVVEALGLTANGPLDIACHDLGTWIGYSYAAEWPDQVKRLAVFDALLPGITPPPPPGIPSAEANVKTWQLAFNRLDDLPEILLQGRERELLAWLFSNKSTRSWTITPADLSEYARVNAAPGATRAALSYYRRNLGPEGIAQTRARAERKLAMPILAFGADGGVGTMVLDTMRLIATDVRGGVFARCGHYMPEEAPRAVAEQIIGFMGK